MMTLLSATIAVIAVLAFQVQDAVRSHRESARAVLQDYAHLACREFIRQTSASLGYYGIAPMLRSFQNLPWPNLPEPVNITSLQLQSLGNPELDPNIRLSFCRLDLGSDQWVISGSHAMSDAAAYGNVLKTLEYDQNWPFAITFGAVPETALVYRQVDQNRYEGFLIDEALLDYFFEWVVRERPLMPISQGSESIDNQRLNLRVTIPSGEIYSQAGLGGDIVAQQYFDYGFKDMQIIIGVDEALAPELIIGGLPRSRLPLLAALLVLSVGLVGVTLVQLRREHDLVQRQTDSVASISHELRTPLAQIQMFSETLLLDRVRSPQESRRAIEIINQETRRMADLVENVIRFSSSLHGMSRPNMGPVDGAVLLHEQVDHFCLTEQEKARYQIEAEPELQLMGDERFVRRMLRNLIDNALKYGPESGIIQLACYRKDGRVCLSVEDQGEGVPPADRERIWQRFERLARHRNTAVAGTGIGLWLVRELAKQQKAQAWVESGANDGARFVIAFREAEARSA
jgi:signal transduction histidine kinase